MAWHDWRVCNHSPTPAISIPVLGRCSCLFTHFPPHFPFFACLRRPCILSTQPSINIARPMHKISEKHLCIVTALLKIAFVRECFPLLVHRGICNTAPFQPRKIMIPARSGPSPPLHVPVIAKLPIFPEFLQSGLVSC